MIGPFESPDNQVWRAPPKPRRTKARARDKRELCPAPALLEMSGPYR